MEHQNITFIGAGNMARSIVLGMLNAFYPQDKITISNHTPDKLRFFDELDVQTTTDNIAAVKHADIVILCVKPFRIGEVCQQIATHLSDTTLVISIAAGVTTQHLESCLGHNNAIVRVMPNTAVSVSSGVTGMFATDSVSPEQEELVEGVFSSIGLVVWLEDESLMPVVTAIFSSGVAYYLRVMELMGEEAVAMGLPDEVVKVMIAQTAFGAAKLALESEESLVELRKAVVSPGGTTASALSSFDKDKLDSTMRNAIRAAVNRSNEMTEELCKL
jgi:pyrroline-5-carboxylate reductase